MKSDAFQIEGFFDSQMQMRESNPHETMDFENVSVHSCQTNKTYSMPPDKQVSEERVICKKYM